MIKTFIFDLGNVIVSFDHRKIAQKLACACEHESDAIFARAVSAPLVSEYNLGRLTSREFFDRLARELDLRLDFKEFYEAWNCTFKPEPVIAESLVQTLSRKYKLLVLSDTNEMHFDFIRASFPVLDYFDEFVLSYRVNAVKPSAEIFRRAVEIAGCRADQCFFVDDVAANVEGAEKCGLHALQFVSPAQFEADLKTLRLI